MIVSAGGDRTVLGVLLIPSRQSARGWLGTNRAAEISVTTISKLERESRPGCYFGTCNKIAVAFGLNLREIIVCGSQLAK